METIKNKLEAFGYWLLLDESKTFEDTCYALIIIGGLLGTIAFFVPPLAGLMGLILVVYIPYKLVFYSMFTLKITAAVLVGLLGYYFGGAGLGLLLFVLMILFF